MYPIYKYYMYMCVYKIQEKTALLLLLVKQIKEKSQIMYKEN